MTQDQLQQSQQATSRQGNLGEQFALSFERKRLPEFLRDNIRHFEEYEIALGYDILSFETRTSILPDRYIEVKTFRGHPHFYWTENEIAAARKYADHYYLYLIDIDRINEPNYEPQIIPNPAVLFDEPLISEEKKRFNAPSSNSSQNGRPWPSHPTTEANGHTWTFHPVQYAFSLNAEANIPHDWDTSTILLGCYNHEQHLRWILDHSLYNVRAQKDIPGAVTLNNPQVRQAKYLILYSVANPRVYMFYALEPKPYRVTKTEMQALGYPNPHAFAYILHPIRERLNTFHIDLAPILREVNHQGDNTYGTPLYLTGIQLRRFMPQPPNPAPTHSEPYMAPSRLELPAPPEPSLAPQTPAPATYQAPSERPSKVAETIRPYPASKQGSLWTPEDDTLLLTHLQQHTSIAELAPLLQRSEKAIVRRMGRLRKAEVIPFALYIHYYDNDSGFALYRKPNPTDSCSPQ